MRKSSFSKSAHHDCCRTRAKSSSCAKCRVKTCTKPITIPKLSAHAFMPQQPHMLHTLRIPSKTSFACPHRNICCDRKGSARKACGLGSGFGPAVAARSVLLVPSARMHMQRCMQLQHRHQQQELDHRPQVHLQRRSQTTNSTSRKSVHVARARKQHLHIFAALLQRAAEVTTTPVAHRPDKQGCQCATNSTAAHSEENNASL